jgi:CheY-like chemotaxis protein
VRIYSELGHGSTVCLYFPRFMSEGGPAPSHIALTAAPRATPGEAVLVVDDEELVRMLVVEVLEELGYVTYEAGDAASSLKTLKSGVRIDLLVTDIGLPGGMNGRQLADAARALRPELKVLFITGYVASAVIDQGHIGPGMHVMTKPFAMEALGTKVGEMIQRH